MVSVLFVILGLEFSGAEQVLLDYLDDNPVISPYFLFCFRGEAREAFQHKFPEKTFDAELDFDRFLFNINPKKYSKKLYDKIKKVLSQRQIDVVYFNNTQEVMLSYIFVKMRQDIFCIGHIHDMRQSIRSPIKRRLIAKSIKKLDKTITVSEAAKSSWKHIDNVIYNGYENNIIIQNRAENQYKTKKLQVGFIGNLSKRKGYKVFYKLYKLCGDQYEFSSVLRSDKKLKTPMPIFYNLKREEVLDYLRKIDVLIVCSFHDPLPTVILEAFSQHVLCVGNSIDGIPEMIQDCRLMVKNNCVKEYQAILNSIAEMGMEERQRIVKRQIQILQLKFNSAQKQSKINQIILNGVKQ